MFREYPTSAILGTTPFIFLLGITFLHVRSLNSGGPLSRLIAGAANGKCTTPPFWSYAAINTQGLPHRAVDHHA